MCGDNQADIQHHRNIFSTCRPLHPTVPRPTSTLEARTETIAKSVPSSSNEKSDRNNKNLPFEVKGIQTESTSEIMGKAAKRLNTDNPEMANPGKQDQLRHNPDVLRTIEKANSVIKGDGETTVTALNEGKKLITDRKSAGTDAVAQNRSHTTLNWLCAQRHTIHYQSRTNTQTDLAR